MMTEQPTTSGQKQPPRLHPHHRALVTETCALVTVADWLLAHAGTPLLITLAILVASGAAAAVVIYGCTANGPLAGCAVGWTVLLTGWLAWARIGHQSWTGRAAAALTITAIIVTAVTLVVYSGLLDERRKVAAEDQEQTRRDALARWDHLLSNLGVEGVRAQEVSGSRAGRTIRYTLPSTGRVTLRSIQAVADGIAAAMKLQPESVVIEQGRHAAEVIVHLDEHDVFAEDLPFPRDTSPLTVNEPFPVGVTADGALVQVLFRQVAAMVAGITGGGKSNVLNVLTAQLTRCSDTMIFMIDLKGGRLAAPWIQPWIDGDCPSPAVEWVATTREEAYLMLTALCRVIDARAGSLHGGSKITPSPEMPQIIVIADEIADIFGITGGGFGEMSNTKLAALGSEVTRKCRSEAVQPVWGTQRLVITMTGGGDLKSQCGLRFALGTASEADARSAVGDDVSAARLIARLRHPGTGIVWHRGDRGAVPVKFFRLDADDDADLLRRLATVAGRTRPALDALSEQAMGSAYTERWQRSELYQRLGAVSPAAPELAALAQQAAPPPAPPKASADEVAQQFRDILAQNPDLGAAKPDPRGRMYALLADKPVMGLSVMEIAAALTRDGLGVARETIHRWLREDIAKGIIRRSGEPGEVGSRYLLIRGTEGADGPAGG
jgi:hypothetical protein